MEKINPSELTPEARYLSRRKFIAGVGVAMLGAFFLSACGRRGVSLPPSPEGADFCASANADASVDELGAKLTSCQDVTHYNNFYEFSTGKEEVAVLAQDFKTSPWEVEVGGMVSKPRTFALEDLLSRFPSEERVYRLRCVEAWSMVIPWL